MLQSTQGAIDCLNLLGIGKPDYRLEESKGEICEDYVIVGKNAHLICMRTFPGQLRLQIE